MFSFVKTISSLESPRFRDRGSPVTSVASARLRDQCVKLKRRGRVAQLVEQRPFKAWVAGSIPAALTILIYPLGLLRRLV
jgi:hypothetical protein